PAAYELLPQADALVRGDHHLDAVLARVARAAQHALGAAAARRRGVVVGEPGGVRVEEAPAQLDGLRALHGDHARLARAARDLAVPAAPVLGQPADDLLAVGGVDDHRPAVGPAVDEHVVADAALRVADQPVAGLPVLHGGGVVAEDVVDQRQRVGPGERQPAHVADVEQPGGGADGGMFLDDAGVLDRHVPAGEVHHAGRAGHVP